MFGLSSAHRQGWYASAGTKGVAWTGIVKDKVNVSRFGRGKEKSWEAEGQAGTCIIEVCWTVV